MTGATAVAPETIWESYVSAWKATGAEAKRAILDDCVADVAVYTDPLASTTGRDELIAYMLDFDHQIPGGHFVTTQFLAHHDRSIAHWNMVDGNGQVIGEGTSYGEYDAGRLTAMIGFFPTPAA